MKKSDTVVTEYVEFCLICGNHTTSRGITRSVEKEEGKKERRTSYSCLYVVIATKGYMEMV